MFSKFFPIIFRQLFVWERKFLGKKIDSAMAASLNEVWSQMKAAAAKYAEENSGVEAKEPRLVAVSKTKSLDMIKDAYNYGQKCFGENYVQELVQKATTLKENGGYDEIKWHFIGRLQRNKVNNLCSAPNLEMVETVDSFKLADSLNRSWTNLQIQRKLKVMVQVNTSQEENKNGCSNVQSCLDLIKHINENCAKLEFVGLMTIGQVRTLNNDEINPDFVSLVSYRTEICNQLGLSPKDVELSMGMSADYVQAILAGSTNVRVGSTIFGKRDSSTNLGT